MKLDKQNQSHSVTLLLILVIFSASTSATTNVDCNGKAFHCFNSTHFKICVDFGGVSKTVDDFLIPCPQNTVCKDSNYYECEYEITTTPAVVSSQSDVANEIIETDRIISTYPWDIHDVTATSSLYDRTTDLADKTSDQAEIFLSSTNNKVSDRLNYLPESDLIELASNSSNRINNELNQIQNETTDSKQTITVDRQSATTFFDLKRNTSNNLKSITLTATTDQYKYAEKENTITTEAYLGLDVFTTPITYNDGLRKINDTRVPLDYIENRTNIESFQEETELQITTENSVNVPIIDKVTVIGTSDLTILTPEVNITDSMSDHVINPTELTAFHFMGHDTTIINEMDTLSPTSTDTKPSRTTNIDELFVNYTKSDNIFPENKVKEYIIQLNNHSLDIVQTNNSNKTNKTLHSDTNTYANKDRIMNNEILSRKDTMNLTALPFNHSLPFTSPITNTSSSTLIIDFKTENVVTESILNNLQTDNDVIFQTKVPRIPSNYTEQVFVMKETGINENNQLSSLLPKGDVISTIATPTVTVPYGAAESEYLSTTIRQKYPNTDTSIINTSVATDQRNNLKEIQIDTDTNEFNNANADNVIQQNMSNANEIMSLSPYIDVKLTAITTVDEFPSTIAINSTISPRILNENQEDTKTAAINSTLDYLQTNNENIDDHTTIKPFNKMVEVFLNPISYTNRIADKEMSLILPKIDLNSTATTSTEKFLYTTADNKFVYSPIKSNNYPVTETIITQSSFNNVRDNNENIIPSRFTEVSSNATVKGMQRSDSNKSENIAISSVSNIDFTWTTSSDNNTVRAGIITKNNVEIQESTTKGLFSTSKTVKEPDTNFDTQISPVLANTYLTLTPLGYTEEITTVTEKASTNKNEIPEKVTNITSLFDKPQLIDNAVTESLLEVNLQNEPVTIDLNKYTTGKKIINGNNTLIPLPYPSKSDVIDVHLPNNTVGDEAMKLVNEFKYKVDESLANSTALKNMYPSNSGKSLQYATDNFTESVDTNGTFPSDQKSVNISTPLNHSSSMNDIVIGTNMPNEEHNEKPYKDNASTQTIFNYLMSHTTETANVNDISKNNFNPSLKAFDFSTTIKTTPNREKGGASTTAYIPTTLSSYSQNILSVEVNTLKETVLESSTLPITKTNTEKITLTTEISQPTPENIALGDLIRTASTPIQHVNTILLREAENTHTYNLQSFKTSNTDKLQSRTENIPTTPIYNVNSRYFTSSTLETVVTEMPSTVSTHMQIINPLVPDLLNNKNLLKSPQPLSNDRKILAENNTAFNETQILSQTPMNVGDPGVISDKSETEETKLEFKIDFPAGNNLPQDIIEKNLAVLTTKSKKNVIPDVVNQFDAPMTKHRSENDSVFYTNNSFTESLNGNEKNKGNGSILSIDKKVNYTSSEENKISTLNLSRGALETKGNGQNNIPTNEMTSKETNTIKVNSEANFLTITALNKFVNTEHSVTVNTNMEKSTNNQMSNNKTNVTKVNNDKEANMNITTQKVNEMDKDGLNDASIITGGFTSTFTCSNRGKYSEGEDCQHFYICMGKSQPIYGKCPNNTVFSEILKQCTKNLSHCVRKNQFQCLSEGRYGDIFSDQFFYICAKKSKGYVRFKLQCLEGYHLDRIQLRCVLEARNDAVSDEDNSKAGLNTMESKSKEVYNDFQCKKEGKFAYPGNCRKYYECRKTAKGFRRRIKECDSDEVFDKKKCVDDDSYECN